MGSAPRSIGNRRPCSARAREIATRAEGERYRAGERAAARFKDAAKDERIRAEASLRLGHVKIEMGRYDEALTALTGAERETDDRAVVYLVHLFRGIALENRGRTDEARARAKIESGGRPGYSSSQPASWRRRDTPRTGAAK